MKIEIKALRGSCECGHGKSASASVDGTPSPPAFLIKWPIALFVMLTACRMLADDPTNVNVVAPSQPQPAASVIEPPNAQTNVETEPLAVNDISILWPVPKTKADADAVISLADTASDGQIMPTAIFKTLIETAKTVNVDGVAIQFPDGSFEDPKTWKVAGIRVNPTALGKIRKHWRRPRCRVSGSSCNR
jgi:hypothetical protein